MFTLPDTFRNKELSVNTQKIYKSKLNALAKAGYDTTAALLANKLQVIRVIKELVPGDDAASRQKKRTFLSAILQPYKTAIVFALFTAHFWAECTTYF